MRSRTGLFSLPARRRVSLLAAETFRFLNQTGLLAELGWGDIGSDSRVCAPSKLWRYNQHYFDDLNALNAEQRCEWHKALMLRWIKENQPGLGMGWDPYPVSLRVVNWVQWHLSKEQLPDACVESLAVQTRWLMRRLEWHILGNHLFANAKALVFLGCFFEGDEADGWLRRGLEIIRKELAEQVLLDGGNFERSPMYHAIFWEDLLDLINLARAYPEVLALKDVESWCEVSKRMQTWLDGMIHPDGEIAFFNDSAVGVAPAPEELIAYAERLDIGVHRRRTEQLLHFESSGYIRLTSPQATAFLDVAPIGPDYLPGHAHADSLSFELSLFGQRVVTNGGVSEYGKGVIRQLERGTAAHSTVMVNGENSSEVWDGFRVARRAYPLGLTIRERDDCMYVSCSHDGYRRLPGKPLHQREWQWMECSLQVTDIVSRSAKNAIAFFHLHPDIDVLESKPRRWTLMLSGGRSVQIFVESGFARLEKSYYAPEFGKRLARACLAIELTDYRAQVRFVWEPRH